MKEGVRRIGARVGNWLTPDQGKRLPASVDRNSLRGYRNYAVFLLWSFNMGDGLLDRRP